MQDFKISVSKSTGIVNLCESTIGRDSENLQKNLVFSFEDEFVNGQGRLEMTIDGQDSWIQLTKDVENETYYVPIKSAITKNGKIFMQLVITEGETEEGIPIFKSNIFYVWVDESINAEIEQPDEYPTWIEIADTKLNEMDNLDIEATKEDDITTITITKKDGTPESVEVKDGQDGVGLDYDWQGTSLGVKREDETNYEYINLQGPKGDPGSIKMQVVQTLPQTGAEDTIYLVPSSDPATQNLYDEYIYTNNAWEMIGTTNIDLSDYATKDELNAKYSKPTNGIPKSDLESAVQTSLEKADSALQEHQQLKTINNESIVGTGNIDIQSGGDTFFLGKTSDYTGQNLLNLDNLEPGLYAFEPSGSSISIGVKGTYNGNDFVGGLSASTGTSNEPRMVYFKILYKIKDMELTSDQIQFASLYLDSFNESDKKLEYKQTFCRVSYSNNQVVINSAYSNTTTFNLVTTGGSQTITAKKTFNVLPESSVVPTTDYQFVNKKYVDDAITSSITTTLGGNY